MGSDPEGLTPEIPVIAGVAYTPPHPQVADRVMPKKKTNEDPAEQLEDFKRLAREIGADADKDGDEVMRRLAKQKRRDSDRK